MEPFTYEDYLYYRKKISTNIEEILGISKAFYDKVCGGVKLKKIGRKLYTLNEENVKYNLERNNINKESKINQPHDKTYKIILSSKKEVVKLINEALKIGNKKYQIKEDEIERYNRSFITKNFKSRESDIIYKMKEKNIFFLIEHQTKKDFEMPYRILEYTMLIMEEALDKTKVKRKDYKFPKVYPIILYTGEGKWMDVTRIENRQERLEDVKEKGFTKYAVIDVNNYTKEELLKRGGILSSVLILEKSKTEKEIIEDMKKITEIKMTEEEKEILKKIIYKIFAKDIEKEKIDEIMKKLENKEEKEMVIEEVLRKAREKEYERGKRLGRKLGVSEGRKLGVSEGRKLGVSEGRKLGVSEGRKLGVSEGRKIGVDEGKKLGRQEEKNKIIIEMIRNRIENNTIMKIVDISEKELEKIKQEYIGKE